MRTIDLAKRQLSLGEVLTLAKSEPVLIHSARGEDFILESADDFDREVAALGNDKDFSSFLESRSNETGDIPLDQIRRQRGL